MANQIDEVTSLTRAFASASTSETDLYREEKLPGKGVGCIALVEIMKGNLVLRETPQLLHPVSAKRQLIHDDEEYEEEEEEAKHLEFCVNVLPSDCDTWMISLGQPISSYTIIFAPLYVFNGRD